MKLAQCLLERFGVAEHNEPLVGDLEEEVRSGRSAWWLWRQVFVAIGGMMARDLWAQKLAVAEAVAVGWAISVSAALFLDRLLVAVGIGGEAFFWIQIEVGFIAGWAVARLYQPYVSVVLALTMWMVVPKLIFLVLGWRDLAANPDSLWHGLAGIAAIGLGVLAGGLPRWNRNLA